MKKLLTFGLFLVCAVALTGCATLLQETTITGNVIPIAGNSVPRVNTVPSNRQTYSGQGFQFQYPKHFSGAIWQSNTWPPVVTLVPLYQNPIAIGCPDMKNTGEQSGTVQGSGSTNDGLHYILHQGGDAGAGQLYSVYCYVVQGVNNYYVFYSVIHTPNGCGGGNCGPYCGTPHEQECKDLDRVKDIQEPLTAVVATLKIGGIAQ